MLLAEKIQDSTYELIKYLSDKINALNDYTIQAILPSLVTLAIYAYTIKLTFIVFFKFLIITIGIVI